MTFTIITYAQFDFYANWQILMTVVDIKCKTISHNLFFFVEGAISTRFFEEAILFYN